MLTLAGRPDYERPRRAPPRNSETEKGKPLHTERLPLCGSPGPSAGRVSSMSLPRAF